MWSFRRKPKPEDAGVPPMSFWGEPPKLTPDLPFLEMRSFQRVFVCDEMMKPHFRHYVLEDLKENVDPLFGFTRQVFALAHHKTDNTIIPIRRRFANIPLARIKGEVYAIPSHKMPILDNFKQNGLIFQRERVRLLLPYRTLTKQFNALERDIYERSSRLSALQDTIISAWMYIGVPDYWEQILLHHEEERDGMVYFTKRYAMRDNGLFLPKTTKHYRAVNIIDKPNNKALEKYYYYTRNQLHNSGTAHSM